MRRIIFVAMLLCAGISRAQTTFTWTGAVDGDWFNADNWDQNQVPGSGDFSVINSGSVFLTNETANLAAFTMTGGTLTFSNWPTRLVADQVTLSAGTLTHGICDTNISGDNIHRVFIAGSNVFIDSAAQIDVYERGYRGGSGPDIPGQGPGGALNNGGGSYGGRGSLATGAGTGVGGPVYGDAADPVLPGSGGGGSGAYGSSDGRPGGGAVRIEATGTVTVNGTIDASCARNSSALVGQGSGGAVSIQCLRFAATNGIINVNGGGRRRNYWSYGGCGGGGRIAIVYDIAEQAVQNQIAMPDITLTADGGNHTGHGGNGTYEHRAWPGSIYLSDASFFPPVGEPLGGGRIEIPGFNAWTPDSLAIQDGLLEFPPGFELTINGDLSIEGSGGGILLSNVTFNLNGDLVDTAEDGYSFILTDASITSRIAGTARLDKFGGWIWYAFGENETVFNIEGDCVLTNSAFIYVNNYTTNTALTGPGARLDVGGDVIIEDVSGIYPAMCVNTTTNGRPTLLKMHDLYIQSGGFISAEGLGYKGGDLPAGITSGYGPGAGKQHGGGGYGGKGGERTVGQGGATYGSETEPLLPGSGGGTQIGDNGLYGGAGGGVVWLDVERRIVLDGVISADGKDISNYAAGGSGGSIYIRCKHFAGGGALLAEGGHSHLSADGGGSGGGGRIAVWRQNHSYTGSASVEAGAAYLEERRGESGTLYWGDIPPGGVIVIFR